MRVWVWCAILFCAVDVEAACTGSSPSWTCSSEADLRTLLTGASVLSGDTVNVAAGTYVFNSRLHIDLGHDFTLKGAGNGTTIFQSGTGLADIIIHLTTAAGSGPTRITGIAIDPNGERAGFNGFIYIDGTTTQLRIDHNAFTVSGDIMIQLNGDNRGSIDNNTFTWLTNDCLTSGGIWTHHPTWGGVGTHGDNSWATDPSIGTANALFIEDNTFDFSFPYVGCDVTGYRFASDGWKGQRVVYRHNTFHNTVLSQHGLESSGRDRGARHIEVWGNIWNLDDATLVANAVDIRGGTVYAFRNTANLTGGASLTSIVNVKSENSADGPSVNTPFGMCGRLVPDRYTLTSLTSSGTTATLTLSDFGINLGPWSGGMDDNTLTISGADQPNYNVTTPVHKVNSTTLTYTCNGTCGTSPATGTIVITSPWNENTNQYGYLCMDQVGAGKGDLISGDNPTPIGVTHQAKTPSYTWDNTKNTVQDLLTIQHPNLIVANQDAFTYNASFNGTTQHGVGMGARASRPASCAVGDAWMATDAGGDWDSGGAANDGTLDVCTAANTWTNAVYTPYTYPHPLQGFVPGSGAGLRGAKGLGLF